MELLFQFSHLELVLTVDHIPGVKLGIVLNILASRVLKYNVDISAGDRAYDRALSGWQIA